MTAGTEKKFCNLNKQKMNFLSPQFKNQFSKIPVRIGTRDENKLIL